MEAPLHLLLPANVMVSSSIDGKPRYGVKVKLPWMRNQVRCGSSFTHPNEASKIAKLFLLAARESCHNCRVPPLAHSDDIIVLDEFDMREAETRGDTITMYRRRSTKRTRCRVVDIVRTCVENVNVKWRRKNMRQGAEAMRNAALMARSAIQLGGMTGMPSPGMPGMHLGMHLGMGGGASNRMQGGAMGAMGSAMGMSSATGMHPAARAMHGGAMMGGAQWSPQAQAQVAHMAAAAQAAALSAPPYSAWSAVANQRVHQMPLHAQPLRQRPRLTAPHASAPLPRAAAAASPAAVAPAAALPPPVASEAPLASIDSCTRRLIELQREPHDSGGDASADSNAATEAAASSISVQVSVDVAGPSNAGAFHSVSDQWLWMMGFDKIALEASVAGADTAAAGAAVGVAAVGVAAVTAAAVDAAAAKAAAEANHRAGASASTAASTPTAVFNDVCPQLASKRSWEPQPGVLTSTTPPYCIVGANDPWCERCGFTLGEAAGNTCGVLQGEDTEASRIALLMEGIRQLGVGDRAHVVSATLTNYTSHNPPKKFTNEISIWEVERTDSPAKEHYFLTLCNMIFDDDTKSTPKAATVPAEAGLLLGIGAAAPMDAG